MGPRAGLDVVMKRKIFSPCQELNPSGCSASLDAISTELLEDESIKGEDNIKMNEIEHEDVN
jgi:hypothetical protein